MLMKKGTFSALVDCIGTTTQRWQKNVIGDVSKMSVKVAFLYSIHSESTAEICDCN
jgi:hypothetical protein